MENIEHPSHYTTGLIEVWDFIADQKLDYFRGNVIKYICRAGLKGGSDYLDDLLKARAYLDKAVSLEMDRRKATCNESD